MKKNLSRREAQEKIDEYFKQKELDTKYTKKIKRLAMKYKIRLGDYRKRFCKKCFSDLKNGRTCVTKNHKIVECSECGEGNKFKIS